MYEVDNRPIGTTGEQVQDVYGGSIWHDMRETLGVGDAASGHWEFDFDEMEAVIKKWRGLLDDLKEDRNKIRRILQSCRTGQPSDDEPTMNYHARLIDGATAMRKSNQSMISYVSEYIEKLQDAKSEIAESDAAAGDALRSTGP